jgi:hypothetical protein
MSSHLRAAMLAGLALLLLLPGQALASSIALIENNNVWLYSPDGSRRKQVTTGGTASRPYSFPSQADNGTILAEIDRLSIATEKCRPIAIEKCRSASITRQRRRPRQPAGGARRVGP